MLPGVKEIPYGSKQHAFFLKYILDRRSFSKNHMSDFHEMWDRADDIMKAYIPERDVDAVRKAKKTNEGIVDYVTVEVPYPYAIVMTFHTYICSIFLSRSPVYQVTARHGESQQSVMGMEALLDYQLRVGEHLAPHFNFLYDFAKYGVAIEGEYWDENQITTTQIVEQPLTIMGIPILGKMKKERITTTLKGYCGNKIFNVRPQDFHPDPRVPIREFQRGEFCGRDMTISWSEIKDAEAQGLYFNVQKLKEIGVGKSGSMDRERGSPRLNLPSTFDMESQVGDDTPGFANGHEMEVKLIPSEVGLGPGNRVETWVFTLAEDEVIICCRPKGEYHGRFSFSVAENSFGTAEFLGQNLIDVVKPIGDIITWLINAHFYNVRTALNDVRVVDPSRIMMKDLERPGPGKTIRLKPEAYGTSTREVVTQLSVSSMTAQHMSDISVMEDLIQRVSGVVDNVMGMFDQSGRRSATESRITTGFSTSRLKTPSEYLSALSWGPMVARLISNTQQYYDQEQMFKIAGTLVNQMQPAVMVTPESIAGFYDYVPVDGTLPIDRLAQAAFWKEMFAALSQSPLAPAFDLTGIAINAMKLQGEKNAERFLAQPGQMPMQALARPQEEIEKDAQAGNVIPLNQASSYGK